MRISRERLAIEAESTGFRSEILEKVIHLLGLLEDLGRHPYLNERLALKGGTALNLFVFDVPRLSVDMDLNYIGAADRETMLVERPRVEEAIHAVFARRAYGVRRAPSEHAGGKWRVTCPSSSGQGANLEVDLNYMLRVPLWPVAAADSNPVGSYVARGVHVLDLHELAAGKLAALFARHASRDLFDAHHLLTQMDLDRRKLRLGFVLYGGMNRKDWRTVAIQDVGYEPRELENQLVPVVRDAFLRQQKSGDWAERMIAECRQALAVVLPMNVQEIEFLNRLIDHGQIEPQLLTDDEGIMDRIRSHPSLQWKAVNVRQHKGK